MKNARQHLTGAAVCIFAWAGIAAADGHVNEAMTKAIEARKAQMTLVGYNMGILSGMAKGETDFDSTRATAAASSLAAMAKLDRSLLWIEGTIQGEVPGTRAKAEIWTDASGFEKAATDFEAATDALIAAAGTDLGSLQAAMKSVGESCGACHKPYRGPRN